MRYALDSDIVSYFLKGNPVIVDRIDLETENGNILIIPPTVYFEVQYWLVKNKSIKRMESFVEMYADQGIGVLDQTIFDTAINVRGELESKGCSIADDDLLIAAYCIKHSLSLVTNNTKHFMHIENLEVLNWQDGDMHPTKDGG